eukprot:CAMPEP_0197665048 /NCGR_PEP_ID=MMETSP1338-20131121/59005_1 /TAXON_ID=43686 ORGANISM="Pelagodinium beii, Strain RCC1491" /NCGR_SAMPLE_ID=MMETSP1338 /ASSEMBLY_ACC=CAM_ASM_000754 /LENGTH=228 /DNA_ID=CAMNT_0043243801 /DNA_START=30 /DNA_END=716 /DNA_ORIENTATION=-
MPHSKAHAGRALRSRSYGLLLSAAAVAVFWLPGEEDLDFVGASPAAREPALARRLKLTGETREIGPEDREWQISQMDRFWWQKPSYLTPNGYKENPCNNKEDYKKLLKEHDFAETESWLVQALKKRGLSSEEIDQQASVYEFKAPEAVEITAKMERLLQLRFLFENRTDELIDLQEEMDNRGPVKRLSQWREPWSSNEMLEWGLDRSARERREQRVPPEPIKWGGEAE